MRPHYAPESKTTLLIVFLSLFVLSGAFTYQIILGPTLSGNRDVLAQIFNNLVPIPFYAFLIWRLARHKSMSARLLNWHWLLLAFIVLAFLSSAWGIEPGRSSVDATTLCLLVLSALGLTVTLSLERLMRLCAIAFVIMMSASLLYIYFIPSYGLMSVTSERQYSTLTGVPQGIFLHKNTLGYMAGISVLFSIVLRKVIPMWLHLSLLSTSISCLILSDSKAKIVSAVVAFIFLQAWLLALRLFGNRFSSMYIAFIVFSTVAVVGSQWIEETLLFLDRDITMSGRVILWRHALEMAMDARWTGYGMASIWGTNMGYVTELPYFDAPHAHNTWLEVLLMLGIPGLTISILIMSRIATSIFFGSGVDAYRQLAIVIFVYILCISFFEFTLFRGNSFPFLLLLVLASHLHLSRVEARRKISQARRLNQRRFALSNRQSC